MACEYCTGALLGPPKETGCWDDVTVAASLPCLVILKVTPAFHGCHGNFIFYHMMRFEGNVTNFEC